MPSLPTRDNIRYHQLSTRQAGADNLSNDDLSGGTSRVGDRRFRNGRRRNLRPKIFVIIFVFCILLLFQYGSRLLGRLDSFEKQENEELSVNNFPFLHDDSQQPSSDYDKYQLDLKQENEEISTNNFLSLPDDLQQTISDNDKYQLNLEHCKIPKLEVLSENYKRFSNEIIPLESCKNETEVSVLQNGIVYLNKESDREKCCISRIYRPLELQNDSYLTGACEKFNQDNQFSMGNNEFVYVSCEHPSLLSTPISPQNDYSFHVHVVPSIFQDKISYWEAKPNKPINILILVLDSVSKLDGHRNLPKTMDYLLNELQFIEYNGYHVISEPTMRNVIPLFFGVDVSEFYKTKSWEEYWDSVPFIWKLFENIKYLTGYLEDMPSTGTFNYGGQKGFLNQPTDFYPRPLFSAHENIVHLGSRRNLRKYCLGQKSIEEYLLEYQFEILKKMNGLVPLFLVPWPCWPQHDFFGNLGQIDNTVFNFFNQIGNSEAILDNTLMVLMSDHAYYTGGYAQTHEGLLERRHPLFLIRLPKNLIKNHPEFVENIKNNANRVTSHYDLHSTLEHIVQLISLSSESKDIPSFHSQNIYGQSLLLPIATNRSCANAGLKPSRCACNLPPPGVNSTTDPLLFSKLKFEEEDYYVKRVSK